MRLLMALNRMAAFAAKEPVGSNHSFWKCRSLFKRMKKRLRFIEFSYATNKIAACARFYWLKVFLEY